VQMSFEPQRAGLFDLARQVWSRRRRLVVLGVAIPLAGALAFAVFMPRHFRSTALVVVERGAGVSDDDVDARLSALTSENLSRSRLGALIARYDLYRGMRKHAASEVLVDKMQKDVRIEIDKEERGGRSVAVAIHVTYTALSPVVAAAVANDLAAFYEREDLRMREQRAQHMRSKLQEQLAEAKRGLDEQQARLTEYKKLHLRELPEQVGMHLSALTQLNQQIRAANVEPAGVAGGSPARRTADGSGVMAPHDERLDRLVQLETQYTREHPDVKRLRREIAMVPFVGAGAALTPHDIADAPASDLVRLAASRARVEGVRRRVEELKEVAAGHERGILNAPFRQQELDALLPDYVAARTRYQSLWEQYEVALLWDPRYDGGRVRVLDAATPRAQAVAPNVPRLIAIGIALSLAAAAALVTVVERLDTSFHTLDDLRSFTRVPVLASLPRLVTSTERRVEVRKAKRFAVLLVLLIALTFLGAAYVGQGASTLVAWMAQSHA
jgi:succinoglycan biosynthesis transport protein ExoP